MSDKAIGRPAYDDDWYRARLDEMAPILSLGNSIYYAANKTGNDAQYETFLEKYKLHDWFSKKINALRSIPGEIANNVAIKLLNGVSAKITNDLPVDRNDIEILKLVAEKHRSAQPFFVTRTETAEADPDKVGKILDTIETDYANLGLQAKGQMVEVDKPLQNPEQDGPVSDVSPQPNPA